MIKWYGATFAFGFFCAHAVSWYLVKRYTSRAQAAINILNGWWLLFVIAGGGIAGRALFVLYNISYFVEYPSEIPAIWHGGWVWHGALIGGGLALFIYARVKKISFLFLADLLAPGVALAQSIGRWGNYFNQELYGLPANIPWAIPIDLENRVSGYESYIYFHPTFLYESLWDFALFLLLFLLAYRLPRQILSGKTEEGEEKFIGGQTDTTVRDNNHDSRHGMIFAFYLIIYSVGRFFIEFLRIDPVPVLFGLRAPQWWSILLICLGVIVLLQRRKKMI